MPAGAFRRVVPVGQFVVKVPRLRAIFEGLRCNRWEREMWRTWRPKFEWAHRCPVSLADPLGLLVVMPRADTVTQDETNAEMPDYWPTVSSECKAADHGRLNGRLVVVDYGLPYADMVREQRANYELRQGPALRFENSPEKLGQ